MRRDLLRRLAKLEERHGPEALPLLRHVWITDCIEEPRRKALAPGERIVLDWYSEVNFEVFARERITTDPCDEGRRCEPRLPLPRGYSELAAPIIVEIPTDPTILNHVRASVTLSIHEENDGGSFAAVAQDRLPAAG